jgi:hypothetical protein
MKELHKSNYDMFFSSLLQEKNRQFQLAKERSRAMNLKDKFNSIPLKATLEESVEEKLILEKYKSKRNRRKK